MLNGNEQMAHLPAQLKGWKCHFSCHDTSMSSKLTYVVASSTSWWEPQGSPEQERSHWLVTGVLTGFTEKRPSYSLKPWVPQTSLSHLNWNRRTAVGNLPFYCQYKHSMFPFDNHFHSNCLFPSLKNGAASITRTPCPPWKPILLSWDLHDPGYTWLSIKCPHYPNKDIPLALVCCRGTSRHLFMHRNFCFLLCRFILSWTTFPQVTEQIYKSTGRDFPGGSVVESPSANAGDADSIPGPGGSHMLQSNRACAPQLLSLHSGGGTATPEPMSQDYEVRVP